MLRCAVCDDPFQPRKHAAGRALVCSPECKRKRRKAQKAAWYAANREDRIRKARDWKARNSEHVRAYGVAWRAANPEYQDDWKAANPEKAREYNRRGATVRRVRVAGLPGRFTTADWRRALAAFGYACAYCGRDDVELGEDHVIPVARLECGPSHDPSNIVPACRSCNSQKNVRLLSEWRPDLVEHVEARLLIVG